MATKAKKRVHKSGYPIILLDWWARCDPQKRAEKAALYSESSLAAIFGKQPAPDEADGYINEIPKYRSDFMVPPPGLHNIRYGGWVIGSKQVLVGKEDDLPIYESTEARRIDFYFGAWKDKKTGNLHFDEPFGQGTERPVVYRLLVRPIKPGVTGKGALRAYPDLIAGELQHLYKTSWGVDPALTLVIAQRESTTALGKAPDDTFNSKKEGGLDSLYKYQVALRTQHFFPEGFPSMLKPTAKKKKGASSILQEERNELGNPIDPARVPVKFAFEAYGAMLNYRLKVFIEFALKNRIGIDNFRVFKVVDELNNLSTDARRVWNIIFFIRPKDGLEYLNRIKDQKLSLEDIVHLEETRARLLHSRMRALVNAGEASLLQKKLKLPPPIEWKVRCGWNLSPRGEAGKLQPPRVDK